MEILRYSETEDTPEITLDRSRNRFEFFGKSLPENADEFYAPILSWFDEYVKEPNKNTLIEFKMDYFNTVTAKKIMKIIHKLEDIHKQRKNVMIHWHYLEIDEDMMEAGQAFSEMVVVPFKIISYSGC